jgi:predicted nucleic acid-binding protein
MLILNAWGMAQSQQMLVDTNVISEVRKGRRADQGVIKFWADAALQHPPLFLSAITIGELRRGVELIRHRGDRQQTEVLERWLAQVMSDFGHRVLPLDAESALAWPHAGDAQHS